MVEITFKATGKMFGKMNPDASEQELMKVLSHELSKIFDFAIVHDVEVKQTKDIGGGYIPQGG